MHELEHLALIWLGVFVAVVAAKKTRLTPVLFFLFVGFVFVNSGVLPVHSGEFIRGLAELAFVVMDIAYVQHNILNEEAFYTLMLASFFLNIAVPVTIAWWQPRCRRTPL